MNIVWLRRDLRVHDNPALHAALSTGNPVVAVYTATPSQWRAHDMAPIQADLIYRRLSALRDELRELGVELYYRQCERFSDSVDAVCEFADEQQALAVYTNHEYELNERKRDDYLSSKLERLSIDWFAFHERCVFPPSSVLNKQGEMFKVFTPFKKAWLALYTPVQIKKTPATSQSAVVSSDSFFLWESCQPFDYPRSDSSRWPVTFDDVRALLREFCHERMPEYHERRDYPAMDMTSRLSPYLTLGIISVRQCLARLHQSQPSYNNAGADTWLSELIWREFYQHLIYFWPELCKGNNFHEWANNLVWNQNGEDWLRKWQLGETGYPIVDAAMRQLNQTGWMHNRLRMIVASFLTKDLHIDWRHGEQYFMRQLIDGDFAANNGGWQWSASTGCDGQPYFRIFNPITQGERFDPHGQFIRQYIPELSGVPDKYIHSPWLWGGVKSLSYPAPIVDHKREREITLGVYKEAKGT